ncbi:peptidoglycan recognition family protein [Haloechinothrix salitolerans]|uniref:N-acetylmuramoyl-L-alanine amidase n=1 Tax=Haloechinothrix salitolerans TaxID=926830 RepID=A0ABW2BZ59_9PSEU
MGYYLLDNPNPHGPHYYETRRKPLRVVVIHITASVEDQDMRGGDESAEQTARYAATTERQVSWHAGADSDSWLPLLPASYTAWHVHGYNSLSWGLEISKRDVSWSDEPPAWVEATLTNAADACRPIVEKYGIPLRRLTRAQVDAGMSGFVYHSDLDPGRRFDPGDDFPIRRFFELMEEGDMPSAKEIAVECRKEIMGHPYPVWIKPNDDSHDELPLWQIIQQARAYAVLNHKRGTALQHALQQHDAGELDADELIEKFREVLADEVLDVDVTVKGEQA